MKGALFESITNAVIDAHLDDSGGQGKRGNLDIDLNPGNNREFIELIFGLRPGFFNQGDYKSSLEGLTRFADQTMVHAGVYKKPKKGKAAGGYIPNYASDLENAIGREAAAGIPINQIRINQKGTLRNSANPMGLAVTNTRDEPTGAIPSFATTIVPKKKPGSGSELEQPTRDLLGTIFAVQAGFSLLTGATSDVEQGFGKVVNQISNFAGTITTGVFAGTALKDFGRSLESTRPRLGAFTKGLGTLSIALSAVTAGFNLFREIYKDQTGITDSTNIVMARLADSAEKASRRLSDLSNVDQRLLQNAVRDLLGSDRTQDTALAALGRVFGKPMNEGLLNTGVIVSETQTKPGQVIIDPGMTEAIRQTFLDAMVEGIGAPQIKDALRLAAKGGATKEFLSETLRSGTFPAEAQKVRTGRGRRGTEVFRNVFEILSEKELKEFERRVNDLREGVRETNKKEGIGGTDPETERILREQKALSINRLRRFGLSVREENLTTFSPAEMTQMQGQAGLVGRGAISAANIAVNTQRFQETAVDDLIIGLEQAIEKSPSLNVDPAQIQKGIEDLSKNLTFAQIETESGISEVISRFLKVSGLDPLDVAGTKGEELNLLAKQIFEAQEQKRLLKEGNNEAEKIRRALELGDASTAAGKAAIEAKNALEGGQLQLRALSAAGAFNRLRGKSELDFTRAIRDSGNNVLLQRQANEAKALRDTLISASETFANNIANGLVDAIVQGKSLGEVLRSAATDFFTMMSRAYMKKAVDSIVAGDGGGGGIMGFVGNMLGIKLNSGGMIRGGSGTRDDVPALLTGGEFVMRKSSVDKYGTGFMSALNQGAIPKFANGGMFVPGSYGQGAIRGKSDLLGFATQTGTSTAADRMVSGANFAAIALAPESIAMTSLGRSMSPAFQRTQEAKSQAFSLFLQQLQADEQRREQLRERERLKKEQRRGLLASFGMAALTGFVSGGGLGTIDKHLGALFGGRKSNRALNQEIFAMYPNTSAKRPMGGMIPYMAGGGGVGYAAGVDTVPAMLSGGEFVMNAAATSRIGASNLQALNSGASMEGGSTSITKGDTNINIVVNSNGSVNQNASADAGAADKGLAVRLKDAVKGVLAEETRLGGMLSA